MLAYVGSSGDMSDAANVDGVAALRQAGSTLKPFLYGMALEDRLLTAASVMDDAPIQLNTPMGLYIPQNYDRDFKGRGERAHRTGLLAQRAGGAHARSGRRGSFCAQLAQLRPGERD